LSVLALGLAGDNWSDEVALAEERFLGVEDIDTMETGEELLLLVLSL
jgi:hypothetical protein